MTDQRGTVSLELSIIGGMLLAMTFAIIDLGQYYYVSTALRAATEITLRNALIDTTLAGCDAPKARLVGQSALATSTGFTMCVTRNQVPGMQSIVVNGSHPYTASVYSLVTRSQTLQEVERIAVPD